MALIPWTKSLINSPLLLVLINVIYYDSIGFSSLTLFVAHARQGTMPTGAQLATRGRRDMSSRVRDVVLSLALCHNVRLPHFFPDFI